MMSQDLESILKDEKPAPEEAKTDPEPKPEADPEPEPTKDVEPDAKGDAQPPDEKTDEPGDKPSSQPADERQDGAPPSEEDDKAAGLQAALTAERKKRQEAEREREEFKSKLAQPKEERPDPFEDPEGARKFDDAQQDQKLWNLQLNMSEQQVRAGPDKDFVETAVTMFEEAAQSDPGLQITLRKQAHPYLWLVNWAKREQSFRDIGDPEEWRTKTRTEIEEKFKADIEALNKSKAETEKRDAVPESLASEPSAQRQRTHQHPGQRPLDEIVK